MTTSSETSLWKTLKEKAPSASLALCLATTALAACRVDSDTRDTMAAAARYNYDYAGGDQNSGMFDTDWYQDCLQGGAYDLDNVRGTSATLNTDEQGYIVVKPANTIGDPLIFTDKGPEELLAPANDTSTRILQSYGCQVGGPYDG